MSKYEGCNIVESVVTPVDRAEPQKKCGKSYFVLRITIAALIIGLILVVHFVNAPWLTPIRDAMRSVFCYDAFGRSVGESAFFAIA